MSTDQRHDRSSRLSKILAIVRNPGMRAFVFVCCAFSLVSALSNIQYDPKIFIAYAVCAGALFWRIQLYAWLMLLTLVLASLSILHMFSIYEIWSMSMSLNNHSATSTGIDPRAVLFLIVFVLLSYPVLKKGFLHFLNSGDEGN